MTYKGSVKEIPAEIPPIPNWMRTDGNGTSVLFTAPFGFPMKVPHSFEIPVGHDIITCRIEPIEEDHRLLALLRDAIVEHRRAQQGAELMPNALAGGGEQKDHVFRVFSKTIIVVYFPYEIRLTGPSFGFGPRVRHLLTTVLAVVNRAIEVIRFQTTNIWLRDLNQTDLEDIAYKYDNDSPDTKMRFLVSLLGPSFLWKHGEPEKPQEMAHIEQMLKDCLPIHLSSRLLIDAQALYIHGRKDLALIQAVAALEAVVSALLGWLSSAEFISEQDVKEHTLGIFRRQFARNDLMSENFLQKAGLTRAVRLVRELLEKTGRVERCSLSRIFNDCSEAVTTRNRTIHGAQRQIKDQQLLRWLHAIGALACLADCLSGDLLQAEITMVGTDKDDLHTLITFGVKFAPTGGFRGDSGTL